MNILVVASYPKADEALSEGADVAVMEARDEHGGWCHVMTSPEDKDLATRITGELGWEEVSRSKGHICLYAHEKRMGEVIEALESLTP